MQKKSNTGNCQLCFEHWEDEQSRYVAESDI